MESKTDVVAKYNKMLNERDGCFENKTNAWASRQWMKKFQGLTLQCLNYLFWKPNEGPLLASSNSLMDPVAKRKAINCVLDE